VPADSALVLDTPFTPAPSAIPPPPPVELVAISRKRAFARRDVFTPAWLPMCASRDLKKGQAKPMSIDLGVMKLVLWRDDDGAVHAMESRCPHMGADLGYGKIVEGELRCALHHWRFRGDDGACTHSSSTTPVRRCATSFPVVEWCGVVFVYPARTPAIAFPATATTLPGGEAISKYRVVVLGEAKLKCHWHLPTANGLDPVHFEGLHGFESLSPWTHDVDEANGAVHLHLDHRPKDPVLRALLGDLKSRFSTIGPSIAWVSAKAPVSMHAFFATRPHADGGCVSRVVLFLPREKPLATLRVLAHVVRLLWQDGVMLNSMHDFRPGYVDTDAPLRAHTKIVDGWPR
jgi:nitrite reductase/ring-hydroxylating ferredoxin subunit